MEKQNITIPHSFDSVNPEPVAVTGNYLGFIWNFGENGEAERREFEKKYMPDAEKEPDIIPLPSGGVLAEAVLSYVGIGVGPDTISWGTMINDARMELARDPVSWWKLFSAFVFMLGLILPANFFGDALRDALDPRLRNEQ